MSQVTETIEIDATHLHWVASIAGVRCEWDALITEQIPDRCVAWTNVDGATGAWRGEVHGGQQMPPSAR